MNTQDVSLYTNIEINGKGISLNKIDANENITVNDNLQLKPILENFKNSSGNNRFENCNHDNNYIKEQLDQYIHRKCTTKLWL